MIFGIKAQTQIEAGGDAKGESLRGKWMKIRIRGDQSTREGRKLDGDHNCIVGGKLDCANEGTTLTKEEPKGEGQGVVSLSIEN